MKDKRFQIGKWVAILGIVIGLAVYLGYCIKIFQLMQMDSDYSNLILEASDILHGNFFMNGWTQTGISFFTTDMLYYLIAVAFIGICQESYWIASGIMLFCVVFCGYLLMNCGQKSWKKRILEFVIFAGICAVPSLLGVNLLRAHTGVYVWGFLGILLVYQLVNKETVTKKQYVFLALVTMLGCIGDALSVIMLVIPAVLYCGWELLSNACEKPRRYAAILGTTVAGMALSFVRISEERSRKPISGPEESHPEDGRSYPKGVIRCLNPFSNQNSRRKRSRPIFSTSISSPVS